MAVELVEDRVGDEYFWCRGVKVGGFGGYDD